MPHSENTCCVPDEARRFRNKQFIVVAEETAGGGKTEAALALASRAIGSGLCRGLFFGLPTMTTTDAQAERQAEIYRRLFGEDANASMTVSHSSIRKGDQLKGSDVSDWPSFANAYAPAA